MFEVGQTVLLVTAREKKPQEVQVTRVGRKIVYIEQYGRERGFHIDTGEQTGPVFGCADVIYTPEQLAYRDRLKAARGRLRELGVDMYRANAITRLSAEKLERIIAIIEED